MSYQLASLDGGRIRPPRSGSAEAGAFGGVVGRSPALLRTLELARKVATRPGLTVLLVGEPGTGKALLARGIHQASLAADEPFLSVSCASVPGTLLEAELFGRESETGHGDGKVRKGLLELAGGGVLYLDEIGDLPTDLQPKFLRALEERRFRRVGGWDEIPVRCRIVAASTSPLESLVADGSLREDLFLCLNLLRIPVPPLRRRMTDVAALATHLLDRLREEQGIGPKTLGPDALEVLESHEWPGNVRELRNVVQRAALSARGPWIEAGDIRLEQRGPAPGFDGEPAGRIAVPATGKSLSRIEAEAVRLTLKLTGGNQSAAARILGVSRPTLLRKIRKYGIDRISSAESP